MAMYILWLARMTALLSCGVLFAFIAGSIVNDRQLPSTTEAIALAFFPAGVILGLLLGWFRPTLGGSVAIVSLLVFYSWHRVAAGDWPQGPYFVLFTLPALLYLLAGGLARRSSAVVL